MVIWAAAVRVVMLRGAFGKGWRVFVLWSRCRLRSTWTRRLPMVATVAEPDVAGQAVQGQVHPGQRDGDLLLLLPVDRQLPVGRALVPFDELGALHEQCRPTARRVEHPAVERLDDLDDQPDDRLRREELPAQPALRHREVRQEVLIDEPERVTRQLARQRREQPQQLHQRRLLQPLVPLRQHVPQLGVVHLHQLHRHTDRGAEILLLRKAHQVGQPRRLGQVQHRPRTVVILCDRPPRAGLGLDLGTDLLEAVLGVRQEDQTEHRTPVLARRKRGVGPQFVGRRPQRALHSAQFSTVHSRPALPFRLSSAELRHGGSQRKDAPHGPCFPRRGDSGPGRRGPGPLSSYRVLMPCGASPPP